MEISYTPTKSITESMNEACNDFEKTYGRTLTEEESILLTDGIRRALRWEADGNPPRIFDTPFDLIEEERRIKMSQKERITK